MTGEPASYDRLLESLADGVPVDWAALAATAASPDEQRRYRNLRLVARIAELHRTIPLQPEAAPEPVEAAGSSPPSLTSWGHLQITKRLAVGSFGDLYLAHDPQLDRDVALKLLRGGASDRPVAQRLLNEAQTLARVRHPNVVTVHGADVREGRAGLWMELVNGRTLEAWLRDNGALGAGEAIAVGKDVCHALSAVHAAGLIHGDVKAHNVMREEGGRIVLMDFGAGQLQGAAAAAAAGTPLYLAPEVLAGAPASVRSDIYSLGVLLFHLLTDRYPCYAADMEELRAAHARGARVRLGDLRPDLKGPLVDAIERALEPDPALRFESAGAMGHALAGTASPSKIHWSVVAVAVVIALAVAVPPIARYFRGPDIDSIAVMSFSAPSGDGAAHLMGGLSSDVLRELQRFDLEVKRGGSDSLAPDHATLQRRLRTDAVVRGSSTLAEGKARLQVSLVRAGGQEIWTGAYDLDPGALPSLARTIAHEIASALRVEVRAGAPAPGHQTNSRAYDAYQRGRVLWEQRDPASLERSVEYFKQAASLDPAYAQPWAGLADAYIAMGVPAFGSLTPLETRRLAKESALRAIELDPHLVEAHTSLAFTAFLHDWNWPVAEQRFQKAIELNPQYPLAHHWYAEFLNEMGRFEEALAQIRRAQALDPMSVLIHRDIAWHYFCQRRYDEAVTQLRETLTLDPRFTPARTLLARALSGKGLHAEALTELETSRQGISEATYLSFKGHIQAASGDQAGALATIAELRRLAARTYVSPYYLALIYAALERQAEALAELERSHAEQDSTLVSVNIDPRFDPLRQEPRFKALLSRMGFPSQKP